jgi:signal transduction histidine kinase
LIILGVFLLLCLYAPGIAAGQGQVVPADFTALPLQEQLQVFEDPRREFSFSQIRSDLAGSFDELGENGANYGFTSSAVWARFALENPGEESRRVYLEIGYPLMDDIRLFVPQSAGGFKELRTGDGRPFSSWELRYRQPVFELQLSPGFSGVYYLRFATSGHLDFPLTLYSPQGLAEKIDDEQMALGLYYGIMLAMAAYNFFLFLSIRQSSYFFYVFFIISYLLMQSSLNGLAYQYLWPEAVWWTNHSIPLFILMVIVSSICFTRRFLLEVCTPKLLDHCFLAIIPLALVAASIGMFVDYATGCVMEDLLALVTAIGIFVVSVLGCLQGYRPARYYLIAWLTVLIGVSIYLLMMLGFLPTTPFTVWSVQIGSALLVILLSLGLADHINVLRQQKERYAADLEETNVKLGSFNEELELRVAERTGELRAANEKLKELDQLKTDFLSTVSHELRTPLTSVLGFAKIIQRKLARSILPVLPEASKEQADARQVQENVEIIVSEGERLTSLINNVLDIAKLEAGRVNWDMQPILVAELFQRARSATSGLFENSSLQFSVEVQEDLPVIQGDQDRLLQVLINLISNAVKFTPEGQVHCRAACKEEDVIIQVEDSGIGIAEQDQAMLFEKFIQAGDTLTDKPKGTGLGLAICKEIVEHHGGQIWLESAPGRGSLFSLTLPLTNQPLVEDY